MQILFKKKTFNYLFIIFVILLIFQYFLLIDSPFFWDAISKSERASWIFDHNFKKFIVPVEINSGHPPLWITLLASFWLIFGKTIWASRLLLLFINIGVVYQILVFCKDNFIKTASIIFVFLVVLEPTLIAQSTSLNNDMLLMFFTLLALNSLINSRSLLFGLALTGLLLTNLRGIYLFLAIGIIHFILDKKNSLEKLKGYSYCYLAPILIFTIFCIFQYRTLGWFIINQTEGLNSHRKIIGFKEIWINILVFVKSFLDYGRIFLFLFLIPLVYKYYNNKLKNNLIDRLILFITVFTIVFFFGTVPFSNPFGDRYFMILFLLILVLFINLLLHLKVKRTKLIIGMITLGFITGHFWIYPSTISQAWDSSLAYFNIYNVEDQMEAYIDSSDILRKDIGTRIPLNARKHSSFLELKPSEYYSEFDIYSNKYILLSNIENNTKDDELLYVRTNWKLIKHVSHLGIYMSLYAKNPS